MSNPEFGSELRRLRTAAGLSLAELAGRIHYSKGYLSKVETGLAQPNHTLASLCDEALDSGGKLAAVVPAHRRPRGRPRKPVARIAGLPPQPAHFTGRAHQLARLRSALLDEHTAACVIDGMAGVGKTALALTAAHGVTGDFPDGSVFLDLRGHTPDAPEVTAADALDRLLRLLGVPGEHIPAEPDDRAAFYRGCLAGRRLLLVLDNASSAAQVRPLLPGGRTCRVLVTSRNRLAALDDAVHLSLDALSPAEAVHLFAAVTGTHVPPPTGPDAEWLPEIVRRCGYLPLAVRIAAARHRANPAWSVADLAARLRDEDAVLRELDDGERSVRAALTLSYRDLTADQRRLLALLATAPGTDIDQRTAAALGGLPLAEATRLVDRLQDGHLLEQHTSGRYEFHDLVRLHTQQAALRDVPAEQRHSALLRLVEHQLHAAESAEARLTPLRFRPEVTYEHLTEARREFTDSAGALAFFRVEWPNLVAVCRAAAGHGLGRQCWQLAFLLRGWFFLAKLWDPWIETHTLALAAARDTGDLWAQGTTLNNLGIARIDRGEIELACACYRQALAVFGELGDEHGRTTALANLGWAHHYRGEHEAARHDLGAALEFYLAHDAGRNAAITLRGLALAEIGLGDIAGAVAHTTDAIRLLDELGPGHELDAAMAFNCLGWAHFRAGAHEEAAGAYRRAIVLGERAGSGHEVARAETGLGNVAAAADRPVEAQRYWDRAEEHHPDLNVVTVAESRVRQESRID